MNQNNIKDVTNINCHKLNLIVQIEVKKALNGART